MKRFALLLILVGLVGAGIWFWKGSTPTATLEGPQMSTATVERGPIRLTVASTGRVVSNLDVEIKCKASGQIINLPHDVSATVKKGDLLMELDPIDEKRLLQQAEVTLAVSEARLAQAKETLSVAERSLQTERKRADSSLKSAQARNKDASAKAERLQSLFQKKLTSEESYETARTAAIAATADLSSAEIRAEELKIEEQALDVKRQDVKIAEAAVETNKINLSIAQQRVKDTVVLAPMDGVIATRGVQIGQIISSGISNVGGGTTAMVLSDLSRLFILASVDESDIGKVAVGQKARITADAFPGQRFRGEIVRIATRGVNTQNVVTFEVKIEVMGQDKGLLKPEMTANVEIVAAEKDDALLVSTEALTRKEGKRMAKVLKADGTTEEKPVEVGINDGMMTEVLGGLAEGDKVQFEKGESDSRWRGGDAARQGRMAQRMMMGGNAGGGRRGG